MIATAFVAEFRRQYINLRRYPTEFLSQIVVVVVIFYGLFLGASYMGGGHMFGNRLNSVIVGYIVWGLIVDSVGSMGFNIANEAQNGTLEQVYLSPLGPTRVLLLRNIAEIVYTLIFMAIVMGLIMLLTGRYLVLSPLDLVPAILAVGASMGIGFMVASVTILFKRSQQLLALLQFALLFLVMTPFSSFPGIWREISIVIPMAPMVGLMKDMMVNNTPMFQDGMWLLWSLVNLALWLTIGMLIFTAACRRARRKGTLSHY